MSYTLNRVDIIGNVARDPEERNFQDGGSIVNMTVATSEKWKDRNTGEQKELTEWNYITIRNPHLCKIAMDYITKGSKVFLTGTLRTRKWTDQSGNDKFTTEIVVGFNGQIIILNNKASGDDSKRQGEPAGGHYYIDDQVPF